MKVINMKGNTRLCFADSAHGMVQMKVMKNPVSFSFLFFFFFFFWGGEVEVLRPSQQFFTHVGTEPPPVLFGR